jgi:hypothetical protein
MNPASRLATHTAPALSVTAFVTVSDDIAASSGDGALTL